MGNLLALRSAFIATLILSFVVVTAAGQLQDAASLLRQARILFDEGRVEDARPLLEKAVAEEPDLADAHYLLARIHLEADPPNLKAAKNAGDRAVELDPDNVEFLGLKLARLHRSSASFLPSLKTRQTQDLAERIVRLDPGNELAHRVLGEIALADYRNARSSVSFPDLDNLDVPAPREAFFNAAYLLNPVLEPGIETEGIEFETSRRYAARSIEYVTKEDEARRRYDAAADHFLKALGANPENVQVYKALLTAAVLADDLERADSVSAAMVRHVPDDPDSWLSRGMVTFWRNREDEAEDAFERALQTMDAAGARAYENTSLFDGERRRDDAAGQGYWASRDPFLLTPVNERRLEHFARMTYADLRFGDLFADRRGWETEPGEVIVRYGVPVGEAQTTTRLDRYLILHYGDFFFKFMDLAKSGKLTFYSPKVGDAAPNFEEIERAFNDDFTLVSREIFREIPERFIYDRRGDRSPVPYMVSSFLAPDNTLDVIVALGISMSADAAGDDIRSAAWLLDDGGGVASVDSGHVDPGVWVTHEGDGYRTYTRQLRASSGRYTMAVEYERAQVNEAGFHRLPVDLRPYPTDRSSISDLLLAYSVEDSDGTKPAGLSRGGFGIEPAPWGVFSVGQPIYVFFETYNLDWGADQLGRTYRIEAFLMPFKGQGDLSRAAERAFSRKDRPAGVSVSYDAVARGRVEPQYLILDTADVDAGTYLVGLRLTDESGHESYTGRAVLLETGSN